MYLANSKGQDLASHLKYVGFASETIANSLKVDSGVFSGFFPLIAKLAGLYHDVGKVDPLFQSYIQDEDDYQPNLGEVSDFVETYPLHHEWSLLAVILSWKTLKKHIQIMHPELQGQSLKDFYATLKYAVYWHHAEQQRPLGLQEIMRNTLSKHPDLIDVLATRFNALFKTVFDVPLSIDEEDIEDALEKIRAVPFIDLSSVQANVDDKFNIIRTALDSNAARMLVRYCLVSADRYVSSLSPGEISTPTALEHYNDDTLLTSIRNYIDKPEYRGSRTDEQILAAKDLAICGTNTLVGPAGSGKTRVALMDYFYSRTLAQSEHQGIVWAVPRVVIGLGVLEEIKKECPEIKVSIISGDHKGIWQGQKQLEQDDLFDADIVILTIDQIAKRFTRHALHDELGVFLDRFVIFDEYHELFAIKSLYWLALLLMKMKEWQVNAHRFVSATPEPFHLKLVASSDYTVEEPIILRSFNSKKMRVNFSGQFDSPSTGSIYVFNTASKAQFTAIEAYQSGNTNFDCFHSKFTPHHRADLTNRILERYGKDAKEAKFTLFSGPIAQAALNISRKFLFTDASSPANLLQRLGRCNRFAEHESGFFNVLVDDANISEKKGQYGYFGRVKNTGTFKHKLLKNKVIDTQASHYAKLSYDFLRYLAKQHGMAPNTALLDVSFDSDMNQMMDHYLAFWRGILSGSHSAKDELFDYVLETAEFLNWNDSFKPTKRVVTNLNGNQEAFISYRGESKLATMLIAQFEDTTWTLKEFIATEDSAEDLVSVNEYDVESIDLVGNLEAAPFSALKQLKSNLKYRAKARGMSEKSTLFSMAKQTEYPLICSHPLHPKQSSMFYLVMGEGENKKLIGFKSFSEGLSELNKKGR